ncbi:hypothetical protein EDB89DRAFT_1913313 [Lactarius sanguifluus]|nr:hypothetical protein EDB89DRAFT_1913313 [Lactarius sanguifluus]
MEPTRRSHAYRAIVRYRSRPFLKISLALRKVPLAASEPLGVSARLGGSSGPRLVASAVGIRNIQAKRNTESLRINEPEIIQIQAPDMATTTQIREDIATEEA